MSQDKEMTLEALSSIKGAEASEVVSALFEVVKNGFVSNTNESTSNEEAVLVNELRPDEVIAASQKEKEILLANFPKKKGRFLVVPKVIEE